MIPTAFLQEWAPHAPWPDPRQIEQDLILCRALCDLSNHPKLKGAIAVRGGTAINKFLFDRPLRYSEDIDLVQTRRQPIGTSIDAIREALSWLGDCSRSVAAHSTHLVFRFTPESDAAVKLKLKVEINTREHECLYGIATYPFAVENGWYTGHAEVPSFRAEALFGTKLRALLQRRKGRDLFDLREGLSKISMDSSRIIAAFEHYLDESALRALSDVWFELIARIKGEQWRQSESIVTRLRQTRYPTLLQRWEPGVADSPAPSV